MWVRRNNRPLLVVAQEVRAGRPQATPVDLLFSEVAAVLAVALKQARQVSPVLHQEGKAERRLSMEVTVEH